MTMTAREIAERMAKRYITNTAWGKSLVQTERFVMRNELVDVLDDVAEAARNGSRT